jgi:tetraacyldisaccharide 4'-kinase
MNPASALFALGVGLRNTLYDRRVLKIHRLARPVVSVGNISIGGSGKTPFVIALGSLLKGLGLGFNVLSRGYGRKSKEIAVADPHGSPEQFGDEPLLITRRLGVPVIVGADRYQAGLLAEEKFPHASLHLLDDGFQHRRLHRDVDIVLVADEDLREPLLPAGRLREPFASLGRADVVVLASDSTMPVPAKTAWRVRRHIRLPGPTARVIAFCGIARPAQFFAELKKLGMDLAETISYPDHHHYRQADIDRLLLAKTRTGAQGFMTTDKDAINLGQLATQLRTLETAGLEMELEAARQAIAQLLSTLEQRCGCRLQPGS